MSGMSAERQAAINEAQEMRAGWIAAEKALMTSQEFRMGTKLLRRADLKEVRESIKYWDGQILSLSGRSRITVRQVVSFE